VNLRACDMPQPRPQPRQATGQSPYLICFGLAQAKSESAAVAAQAASAPASTLTGIAAGLPMWMLLKRVRAKFRVYISPALCKGEIAVDRRRSELPQVVSFKAQPLKFLVS